MAPHSSSSPLVPQCPVPQPEVCSSWKQPGLRLSVLHVVSASAFLSKCPRLASVSSSPSVSDQLKHWKTSQESGGQGSWHGATSHNWGDLHPPDRASSDQCQSEGCLLLLRVLPGRTHMLKVSAGGAWSAGWGDAISRAISPHPRGWGARKVASRAVLSTEKHVFGPRPWERQGEVTRLRRRNCPQGLPLCHFCQEAHRRLCPL